MGKTDGARVLYNEGTLGASIPLSKMREGAAVAVEVGREGRQK